VFWLATEDHDFGEINHVDVVRRDGEVGRVGFDWTGKGRPISAMPLTEEVREALARYWIESAPGPHTAYAQALYTPQEGEDYAAWCARSWSTLFADSGLVIVEPRTLRPAAGGLFAAALRHREEIGRLMASVATELSARGYSPLLDPESSGQLFTFDGEGMRVRVSDADAQVDDAASHPERYSTDAALRPLIADALLPVVASVLGPGELAYQGMLRAVYALFDVPQPVLFPRKSYTVASAEEVERLTAYHTSVRAVLTGDVDADAVFQHLIPDEEIALFGVAERQTEAALSPLRAYLVDIDPSLGRTWEQTMVNARRNLEKLQERAFKSRLSQLGYSRRELRQLQNALLPRNQLQERVLPLLHLLARHGPSFLDELLSAGDLYDFDHHVLVVGGADD
jgi:bacillithiol biosynthesis cysteine-adding enzyme BshC